MAMAVAVMGLAVAVLGWLAAMVAPKVPPDNVDQPGAWITPDDFSVQPWAAVMFVAGMALVLVGLTADGVAESTGWSDLGSLGVVLAGLGALIVWVFLIWAATHKSGSSR